MWKRPAALLLQLLLAVVVVEVGLQVIAFFVQRTTRGEMQTAWAEDDLRILCLGDSNTYGVRVARDKTWPKQLETLWNERGEPEIEVLNLGFPGTNSSRLVRDLPDLLERLEPDLTIVMVGVNDFWTVPFQVEEEEEEPPESFWKRHSKLYRFYYLVRTGLEKDEEENTIEIVLDPEARREHAAHKVRIGDREFDTSFTMAAPGKRAGQAHLARNLHRIVEQAAAGSTRLVLMSYPAGDQKLYRIANPTIWKVASETNTPVINLTRVFAPLCPELECPSYMLNDNHHPNARGYGVVAETVSRRLRNIVERRSQSVRPDAQGLEPIEESG